MLTTLRSKILALKSHEGFRRYAANTSWMLGEKILRMTAGLFVGIWVARYLGPEQFGLLSYAQSFVFLFSAIATLGLDGIVIRELVKNPENKNKLLGTAFALKLCGSLLILPFIWLGIQFTNNDSYTNTLIFIIASSTILQSFNVVDFYCQSKVQSKYIAWVSSFSLGLSSIVKIILILFKSELLFFAFMSVFDAVVLAIGFVFIYKVMLKKKIRIWSIDYKLAKSLLTDSWPLVLSGMIVSVYMKVDQVMLKEMMGPEAVGQYAAAVRLSEAWYFIPMMITASLFPAIINAKKISQEVYLNRLKNLYRLMVWMAISIALPMTFLSEWITTLLYGLEYNQSATVLMIHVWAGVFVFMGVAFSKFLTVENMVMKSLYRASTGMIVNLVLNLLLIPLYGIAGAAVSTLIGQLFANLIYDFFDKDLKGHLVIKLKSFYPSLETDL